MRKEIEDELRKKNLVINSNFPYHSSVEEIIGRTPDETEVVFPAMVSSVRGHVPSSGTTLGPLLTIRKKDILPKVQEVDILLDSQTMVYFSYAGPETKLVSKNMRDNILSEGTILEEVILESLTLIV